MDFGTRDGPPVRRAREVLRERVAALLEEQRRREERVRLRRGAGTSRRFEARDARRGRGRPFGDGIVTISDPGGERRAEGEAGPMPPDQGASRRMARLLDELGR